MPIVAVEVQVTGRVQGVFYRDTCRREARRLGVTGWVRNDADGSVRAHVEGEEADVEALVAWCRRGSPQSRVEAVDVATGEVQRTSDFEVRG